MQAYRFSPKGSMVKMHKYLPYFSESILLILYIFVKTLDHSHCSLPNAFRAVSPANSACNPCPAGPAITKKGNLHNPPGKKIIHTLDHFLTYIPGQLSKNSNRHRTPAFSLFNAKMSIFVQAISAPLTAPPSETAVQQLDGAYPGGFAPPGAALPDAGPEQPVHGAALAARRDGRHGPAFRALFPAALGRSSLALDGTMDGQSLDAAAKALGGAVGVGGRAGVLLQIDFFSGHCVFSFRAWPAAPAFLPLRRCSNRRRARQTRISAHARAAHSRTVIIVSTVSPPHTASRRRCTGEQYQTLQYDYL